MDRLREQAMNVGEMNVGEMSKRGRPPDTVEGAYFECSECLARVPLLALTRPTVTADGVRVVAIPDPHCQCRGFPGAAMMLRVFPGMPEHVGYRETG